ncbi:M20/M25/M40 family metallo-hydrolase [Candidatus Neomarinimicrobiota bacterium]
MSPVMQQSLIDLFLQLVRINAVSGAEKPVVEFIREFLSKYEVDVQEDDAHIIDGGNAGNVICRIGGGGNTVLLAHMDTARPTENVHPQVGSDRITSDQSTILGADNRAGVAILLYTLQQALEQTHPCQNFTAVFTVCEETTLSGSRYLTLGKQIEMGYVFDSSLRPGSFIQETYGAQRFEVHVNGKAAHSGLEPEKGVNAILAAGRAISNLTLGRLNGGVLANIGTINGGTGINVVPAEVHMEGEVRGRERSDVLATVEHISNSFLEAARPLEASVDFDAVWDFESYSIQSTEQVYQRLVGAMEQVGLAPIPIVSPGGSDANSLHLKGIRATNLGIGAQNPHSNEEFILIEDLIKGAELALQLVQKV